MSQIRLDRLSALVARFALDVSADSTSRTILAIYADAQTDAPGRVVLALDNEQRVSSGHTETPLFQAHVRWGGDSNPLIGALPARIELALVDDPEMQSIAALLVSESQQQRCGSSSVINRLGEVLLVRLLRAQLASGTTEVGLLGGLADPRLGPTLVAIHEQPGQRWSLERLAEIAGLSVSRFADRFTRTVGQTPMAYLRHWRMLLARQDIERGDRIGRVAHRYGYASSEALARAFRRQFGCSPLQLRHPQPTHSHVA